MVWLPLHVPLNQLGRVPPRNAHLAMSFNRYLKTENKKETKTHGWTYIPMKVDVLIALISKKSHGQTDPQLSSYPDSPYGQTVDFFVTLPCCTTRPLHQF